MKYKGLSNTKKAIIWYTLATLIQRGISFVVTPVYTRLLSDSQYGMYSLFHTGLQIMCIVSIVAMDRCVTVGFEKFQGEREEFLSSVQALMTLTCAVTFFLIFAFSELIQKIINLPVYMFGLMILLSLTMGSFSNWTWYCRFKNEYKKVVIVTIVFAVLIQALAMFLVVNSNSEQRANMLIMGFSIGTIALNFIIYIWIAYRGKCLVCRKYWRFAFSYSVVLVPHALAQIILNSSDRIMIDVYCSRDEVAYYAVTYNAVLLVNMVISSLHGAIQPWYFERMRKADYQSIYKKTNELLVLVVVLCIVTMLFAPELMMILAPSSYQKAVRIVPLVATSCFFNFLFLCFSNFEAFYEKPLYMSIATLIGALLNIVLNAIFIPKYGAIAAGYTTLICYIVYASMHYAFMRIICKKKINGLQPFDIKFMVSVALFIIVLTAIFEVIYQYPVIRYGLLGLVILLVVVMHKKISVFLRNICG